MTNDQALKQAAKRWGKKALIENKGRFSSPERRATASENAAAARARIKAIDQEIADRLKAMDWYQALTSERKELQKTESENAGMAMFHRFSVGKDMGLFFEVLGSGDTWEEAFAESDAKS